MEERSIIYGIDLGTTFSAIARVNAQNEAVCLNIGEQGEWTIPSAVLLDGHKAYVGEQAIENCWKPDTLLVEFAKRSIGLQKSPGWPKNYGGWKYMPEEISALVLRKVALQVDAGRTNPPVRDVVVSHPQWFYLSQKETTREAVELAGLNLVATITEPNAAAIAYGVYERSESRPTTVLVFDLGGGTFDLSLMRVGQRRFEMLSSGGDPQLGGIDWDQQIIQHAKEKFQQATGDEFDDVATEEEQVALRKSAERAKKKLTEQNEVAILVSTEEARTRVVLTRDEFEGLTRTLVTRCLRKCDEMFTESGYDWSHADEILLVGSSTKMPMIAEAVRRASGKEPRLDKDPKLLVAKGAAIWGEWIRTGRIDANWAASEEAHEAAGLEDRDAPTIVGRTAHGLGVLATRQRADDASGRVQSETFVSLLIKPNTETPHTVTKTFYTNRDNETSIPVPLYEGESEDPEDCNRIGQVIIDGLPPRPRHQKVDVKFHIDTSGLLEVELTHIETGLKTVKRLEKSILRSAAAGREPEIGLEERRRHLESLEMV